MGGELIFSFSPFYKKLFNTALPIIIQNLLSTIIAILDTFMLGFVGQNELAAIALANQFYFILSLFFLGITSNIGILISQYLGKNDLFKVNQIFLLSCKCSLFVCFIFAFTAIFFSGNIMSLFTNNIILIDLGKQYLQIVGLSYLFSGFSQVYLMTLKTMLQLKKSIYISLSSIFINFILNAVFIFGLFSFPKLGIIGVAIATCIARFFELIYCCIDLKKYKPVTCDFTIKISFTLYKDYFKIGTPIMLQGFIWGGAMSIIASITGHLGTDMTAANSIASTIQNIATVISFGLTQAGLILLGKDLGNNQFTIAKKHSFSLLKISLFFGILCCCVMLILEQFLFPFLFLTTTAQYYLFIMYKILAINVIFASITYAILCGIFPAGGYTKYGLYLDGTIMWSLVFIGFLFTFINDLNPIFIFLIFNIDELIKTPFVLKKYFQYEWIKNITK